MIKKIKPSYIKESRKIDEVEKKKVSRESKLFHKPEIKAINSLKDKMSRYLNNKSINAEQTDEINPL